MAKSKTPDEICAKLTTEIKEREEKLMDKEIEMKSIQREHDEYQVKIDDNRKHASPLGTAIEKAVEKIEELNILIDNNNRTLTSLAEEAKPWIVERNRIQEEKDKVSNEMNVLKKEIDRLGHELTKESQVPSLPGLAAAEEMMEGE